MRPVGSAKYRGFVALTCKGPTAVCRLVLDTVSVAESRSPSIWTRISTVPDAAPTAVPNELIVATAGSLDCHATWVSSRDEPSAKDPFARNATTSPRPTVALRGAMVMAVSLVCSLELLHATSTTRPNPRVHGMLGRNC